MASVTSLMGPEIHGCTLIGFRHFMAETATNPSEDESRDGNIEHARLILGHASIRQTQHYNKTKDVVLRNQMEKIQKERNIVFRREG